MTAIEKDEKLTANEKYEKLTTRTIQKLSELQPGDHIRVQGEGGGGSFASHSTSTSTSSSTSGSGKTNGKKGAYTHHLLVVSVIDEKSIQVIHHVKDRRVREVTKFYKPEQITVLDYDSKYTGQGAVKRARSIGKGFAEYKLATNNCEHFVTEARTGEKISNQVSSTAVGGVAGGAVGIAVGTAGGASAGVLVGAGIGSVVPIAGTIIGGVIGGFVGGVLGFFALGAAGAGAGTAGGLKVANRKKKKEKK